MGYGMYFPAHQVGGQLELWGIRSYGVSGVWVKRSSTVVEFYFPSKIRPRTARYVLPKGLESRNLSLQPEKIH
jgi:hypothetical protein